MTTIHTIEDLVRLLDEHPEWVEALRVRLLTRELIELPQTFARFAEATNQRLERLETDVGQLKADVGQLKTDVGHLNGWALESKLHSKIVPIISQRLGMRRPEIMWSPVQQMRAELGDLLEDSAAGKLISEREEQRVIATDFILRARWRESGEPVWVAVEASCQVRCGDVERAKETADILGRIFGDETVAVVAGYGIDLDGQRAAEGMGVVYMEVSEDWG